MNQPNETGRTIEQTFQRETYDKEAKHLLALTEVAARILQGVVAEFQNKSLAEIEACIVKDSIQIADSPVFPPAGSYQERLLQRANEDHFDWKEIRFDVLFDALLDTTLESGAKLSSPTSKTSVSKRIKLIINFEAQRIFNPGYDLTPRTIYYGARLLSSQLGREFDSEDYDSLCKVYSIWIYTNATGSAKNSITRFHFTPERLYGTRENLGRYDMIEVIQIGLGTDIKDNTLLGFLYVLFKYQGTLADKKKLLETRFQMKLKIGRAHV